MENFRRFVRQRVSEGELVNIAVKAKKGNRELEYYAAKDGQIDESTLFDMASVTKVMTTSSLALIALDRGLIKLDDSVSRFFSCPDDKKKITVENMLTHRVGIGWKQLWGDGINYGNIAEHILSIPSDIPIGGETLYSCPGFILLGKVLEKVFGGRLDELFIKYVATPLSLTDSTFLPKCNADIVNANPEAELKGVVNDYNCRNLGGVAGNAGLFSCIKDVTKFVKCFINRGAPLISEKTFDLMRKNYTPECSESRALGFVYVDNKYAQTGSLFNDGALGHCGHTGQSVFFDYRTGDYAIILSDATLSTIKKYGGERYDRVMTLREELHNAIAAYFENI